MSLAANKIYDFEGFRLDVRERILSYAGEPLHITDKAFELLRVLIERTGHLVTKDDLLSEIWNGSFVEENTLDKNVSLLRRTFAKNNGHTKLIETVRGHGYRFIGKVTVSGSQASEAAAEIDGSDLPRDETSAIKLPTLETAVSSPDKPRYLDVVTGPRKKIGFAAAGLIALLTVSTYLFLISRNRISAEDQTIKTIAVLPILNKTDDPNSEYLSDGVTEGIINDLSKISGLRVMSRSSVFRFKDNQADLPRVAAQLGVNFAVTGEIRRLESKFEISIRLVDIRNGTQIWGHQYFKSSEDLLNLQEEISADVAENLRVRLAPAEREAIAKRSTNNPQAYQYYLLGRYHLARLTEPEVLSSIDYFQKAIAADPSFAYAYVGLALAYRPLALAGWHLSSEEAIKRSRAAAIRALEIDPDLASAHAAYAWTLYTYEHDWSRAEHEFRRALELAPNDEKTHADIAHMLTFLGRHTEAIAEGKKATELDPLSFMSATMYAQFLFFGGKTDEALVELQKTFEIEPNFWIAHNLLGRIYVSQERYPEALAEFQKARDLSGFGSIVPIYEIGYTYARMGDRPAAEATIRELKKSASTRFVSSYSYAMIYNGLDDRLNALKYLEMSVDAHEADSLFLNDSHRWDAYRGLEKFQEIEKKLNLN